MEETINIGEDIGADTEWKGYKEKEREMERRKGNKEERERESRETGPRRAWGLILIPPRERGVVDVTFMKCYNLCKP